jgi:hypothetical protein
MYFVSDPGGKLENIRRNPSVCLAVFIPVGKGYMTNARGLQMWGKAQIITKENDPEEAKQNLTIVKVVPHKISYFFPWEKNRLSTSGRQIKKGGQLQQTIRTFHKAQQEKTDEEQPDRDYFRLPRQQE